MESKYIKWSTLAFMAFSTVWGFGNVLNGFVYFNGIQVIFSWILMFALYFVPYALFCTMPVPPVLCEALYSTIVSSEP